MAKKINGFSLRKQDLLDLPVYIGKGGTEWINLTQIMFEERDDYGNDGKIIQTVSKSEREAMKLEKEYLPTIGYVTTLFDKNQ